MSNSSYKIHLGIFRVVMSKSSLVLCYRILFETGFSVILYNQLCFQGCQRSGGFFSSVLFVIKTRSDQATGTVLNLFRYTVVRSIGTTMFSFHKVISIAKPKLKEAWIWKPYRHGCHP